MHPSKSQLQRTPIRKSPAMLCAHATTQRSAESGTVRGVRGKQATHRGGIFLAHAPARPCSATTTSCACFVVTAAAVRMDAVG